MPYAFARLDHYENNCCPERLVQVPNLRSQGSPIPEASGESLLSQEV